MEIKVGERVVSDLENNENRRRYIIEKYKEYIPDIEDHVYSNRKPKFDFGFIAKEDRSKRILHRFNELSNIIVDIRNNTTATNYYSNSINKTDNKYSNETKKMVKHLLSKGWTNNEIAYEIEKVYGSGAITYYYGLEPEPTISSILAYSAFKLFYTYFCYRLGKGLVTKYIKKK